MPSAHDLLVDKWIEFGKAAGIPDQQIFDGTKLILQCLIDGDSWPDDISPLHQTYLNIVYREGQGLVYLCEVFSIRNGVRDKAATLAGRRVHRARAALFKAVKGRLP